MATKKTEVTEEVTEEVKETKEGEKKVRIRLPKDKNGGGAEFVSVNERTFLVKRGEYVDVPECVAEVIRNSKRFSDAALDYDVSNRK